MESLPKIASIGEACCGCGACAARCPKACVSMAADACGFLRPEVDAGTCIRCGGCDSVCPALNKREAVQPQSVLWAKSKNEEEKLHSSSGGLFALFAHEVLAAGGIVVGAAWEPGCKKLCHVVVESEGALDSIMRSKYVQSFIDRETYEAVRAALKANRKVLFAGTACQIAGMRAYLGKLADSDGFMAIDVICHGVPSPKLWQKWLEYREGCAQAQVREANFRGKTGGWLSYRVQYEYCTRKDAPPRTESAVFNQDWYMRAFLHNASLRGSCFRCPAKRSCGSDVTLGDYWGIQSAHSEVDYEYGVSAVLVNTARGAAALEGIKPKLEYGESSIAKVLPGNPCLEHSVQPYAGRDQLLQAVAAGVPIPTMQQQWSFEPTFAQKLRAKLGTIKRKIVPCGKLKF